MDAQVYNKSYNLFELYVQLIGVLVAQEDVVKYLPELRARLFLVRSACLYRLLGAVERVRLWAIHPLNFITLRGGRPVTLKLLSKVGFGLFLDD